MMTKIIYANGTGRVSLRDRLRWKRSLPLAVLIFVCFALSPGFSRKMKPLPPAAVTYGEATQIGTITSQSLAEISGHDAEPHCQGPVVGT